MTCECPAHQWLGRECECLCDHNEDSPETKVMRVKRHFREKKDLYIGVGVGLVVAGGAAVAYNIIKSTNDITLENDSDVYMGANQDVTVVGWRNTVTPMLIQIVERSCLSKPVRIKDTNQIFDSINDAVRQTGRTRYDIKTSGDFEFLELPDSAQKLHAL